MTLDAIRVEPDETVGEPAHVATGPLSDILNALTDGVGRRTTWAVSEIEGFWSQAMHELGAAETGLNATNVLVAARRMAPRDTILATEAGVYGRVNLYAWKVFDPSTYFDSSGANTMGFSIPASLAATLVRPNQKTISLIGDAGLLMRAGELEVAARLKLAPVVVVFDDTTLGMIRVKQRSKGYARERGTHERGSTSRKRISSGSPRALVAWARRYIGWMSSNRLSRQPWTRTGST